MQSQDCVHHWICESPGLGHAVEARCKLCGMERTFYPEKEFGKFLDARSKQARMANKKGQPRRHPKKEVAA